MFQNLLRKCRKSMFGEVITRVLKCTARVEQDSNKHPFPYRLKRRWEACNDVVDCEQNDKADGKALAV